MQRRLHHAVIWLGMFNPVCAAVAAHVLLEVPLAKKDVDTGRCINNTHAAPHPVIQKRAVRHAGLLLLLRQGCLLVCVAFDQQHQHKQQRGLQRASNSPCLRRLLHARSVWAWSVEAAGVDAAAVQGVNCYVVPSAFPGWFCFTAHLLRTLGKEKRSRDGFCRVCAATTRRPALLTRRRHRGRCAV